MIDHSGSAFLLYKKRDSQEHVLMLAIKADKTRQFLDKPITLRWVESFVTEAVQAVVGMHCCLYYCGSWCTGMFCIILFRVWFDSHKVHSSCKNLNDQVRSGRPKTMDSEALFKAIEANLASIRQAQYFTV